MTGEWVVRGHVQGVGFRRWAQREARRLGLWGWVRNEPDGSVRAHADGDATEIARFAGILRRGPSTGHVSALVEAPLTAPVGAPASAEDGFVVLR